MVGCCILGTLIPVFTIFYVHLRGRMHSCDYIVRYIAVRYVTHRLPLRYRCYLHSACRYVFVTTQVGTFTLRGGDVGRPFIWYLHIALEFGVVVVRSIVRCDTGVVVTITIPLMLMVINFTLLMCSLFLRGRIRCRCRTYVPHCILRFVVCTRCRYIYTCDLLLR